MLSSPHPAAFAKQTAAPIHLGSPSAAAGALLLVSSWTVFGRNDWCTTGPLATLAALVAVFSLWDRERRRRRVRDPVTEVPTGFIGKFLDICPRRAAETALQEGEALLRSVIDSTLMAAVDDLLAHSKAEAGALDSSTKVESVAAPVGALLPPRRIGRILLVEDSDVNQRLAFALLDLRGHSVDIVGGGAEAVALVVERAYDIVLMDVRMPGMDGLTATRLIRGAGGMSSKVPIIAMTADVYPEQIEAFRKAGMDDHVGKPLRRAQLYAIVDRWLLRDATPIDAAIRGSRDAIAHGTSQAFDIEVYDRLLSYIGREKLDDILSRFAASLPRRFGSGDGEPEALHRWAADAHVVLSAAGMTGFGQLAAACRMLQGAEPGSEHYRSSLDAARAARDTALQVLPDLRRRLAVAE